MYVCMCGVIEHRKNEGKGLIATFGAAVLICAVSPLDQRDCYSVSTSTYKNSRVQMNRLLPKRNITHFQPLDMSIFYRINDSNGGKDRSV
jgi:hypothetical protein